MDNTVLYIAGGLATAIGTVSWWAIRAMHGRIVELERALSAHQLHVAESYVNKSDFKDAIESLSTKLDRIESKLDNKADK
jgi:hypothetical protein